MSGLTSAAPVITEKVKTRVRDRDRGPGRWWLAEGSQQTAAAVFETCQRIESRQQGRRLELERFQVLYENEGNGRVDKYGRIPVSWRGGRLSFNVGRSCVDTVAAKIGKNRPRPIFLTNDADYPLEQKAKKLTDFLDGVFDASKIYEEGPRAFMDACIFDGGAVRLFVDDAGPDEVPQLRAERVAIFELLIDENEALYGKPRQLHQKRRIAREVLAEMYPDSADKIDDAPSAPSTDSWESDMVEVVESWHIPSKVGGGDGRHTVCIEGCALSDEKYTKDYFPFVFFFWTQPVLGFWGTGLLAEVLGIQIEIDRLLKDIRAAQHRMAFGKVILPKGSGVAKDALTSEPGGIVEADMTSGQSPVWAPGVSIPGDVYAHLDRLVRAAYELCGVSQASAGGKKPAGVDAAVAIREVNDIETERFSLRALRYERMYLDAARIFIDMARDLAEEGKLIKVKTRAGKFLSTIKWDEVDLTDDQFVMDMFPTSLLPTQPAGRLQTVTELVQAGFLEKEEALSLLDMPDVQKAISLRTAALDDARMVVDSMLNGGPFVEPEPFMNLELARSIAQSSYLRGKTKKVPEADLQKLRDFMDACTTMLEPVKPAEPVLGAPPAAPPMLDGALPPMPPMATPMGAPESPLLPVMPAAA